MVTLLFIGKKTPFIPPLLETVRYLYVYDRESGHRLTVLYVHLPLRDLIHHRVRTCHTPGTINFPDISTNRNLTEPPELLSLTVRVQSVDN